MDSTLGKPFIWLAGRKPDMCDKSEAGVEAWVHHMNDQRTMLFETHTGMSFAFPRTKDGVKKQWWTPAITANYVKLKQDSPLTR